MFSKKDITQIKNRNIRIEQIKEQITSLQNGFPYINLNRSAIVNDGIHVFDDKQIESFSKTYEQKSKKLVLLKFVPASGAATRMFKMLYNFIQNYKNTEKDFLKFISDKNPDSVNQFFMNLNKYPFYNDLMKVMHKKKKDIQKLLKRKKYIKILKLILTEKGLNLGNLPKALIKFHRYTNSTRTPLGEHLVEASLYCKNVQNQANLHFTISPDHQNRFETYLKKFKKKFEEKYSVKYRIGFSIQKPHSDTIAIDKKGNLFRDKRGNIYFRPGGHGSLIENLSEIDADIIFIKNIDNVVPDRLKDSTILHKKALGGFLLEIKEKIHNYLHKIEADQMSSVELKNVRKFIKKNLGINIETTHRKDIFRLLNRPIRVCGMVPNEGEPGGGPFWITNEKGKTSLQIVETSQIDRSDKKQYKILATATHFNPVDLVCYTKDYKGNKFDLLKYVDKNTGFISEKSYDGRYLKALEHPGLWNGAMANWNTLFVEVPSITFNPVKTVFDLLRPEHIN